MKIVLASDHAGFWLKGQIANFLTEGGYTVEDLGPYSLDPNDDYPDYISLAARRVSADPEHIKGIIIGGSGVGEAIVANRFPHVRAGVFYGTVIPQSAVDIAGAENKDPYAIVTLSRTHDDSNMLSLGARFLSLEDALHAVDLWLKTPFSGEARHLRRVKKIDSNNG